MHLPARRLTAALAGAGLCLSIAVSALPALATTTDPADAELLAELVTVGDDNGLDFDADGSVLHEVSTQAVAPGLDLTSFQRLEEDGWTSGNILKADLTEPTLSMKVLDSGATTSPATVLDQVKDSGAVAAVNGNHFDMNYSGAPVFTTISDGEIVNGYSQPAPAFTLADGVAAIEYLSASGTLAVGDSTHDLAGLNRATIPANSIGVYNERWGSASLDRPAGLPGETNVASAVIADGVVTAVADTAGTPTFPEDGQILLGRGAGADVLRALEVGQAVDITVEPSADVDLALAGNVPLVLGGELAEFPDEAVAARTVLGLTQDGSELLVATVDGRRATARGLTRVEMAELMIDLGAHSAVNIDGGGSTTMVARPAGGTELELVNTPSDGSARSVANSLAFFSSADTEQLTDVAVRPALDGEDAAHVIPGLHRTIEGVGLSEQLAGTDAQGQFTVTSPGSLPNGNDANAVITEEMKTGARRGPPPHARSSRFRPPPGDERVHGPATRLDWGGGAQAQDVAAELRDSHLRTADPVREQRDEDEVGDAPAVLVPCERARVGNIGGRLGLVVLRRAGEPVARREVRPVGLGKLHGHVPVRCVQQETARLVAQGCDRVGPVDGDFLVGDHVPGWLSPLLSVRASAQLRSPQPHFSSLRRPGF